MLMDNNGSLVAAAAVSPSSPTPQQQKQIIQDLTNNSISKPGNSFFLVSNRWFTGWKKYVGFGADRPGPIDNSYIVAVGSNSEGEDLQLLDNLEEERDYVVVSQDVWEKLFEWYKGGPVLPRKMISVGVRQELVVEEYPLCLKLIDARDESELTIRLSKKASLHELHERVCSLKRTGKVRIWDYFNNRKQALLEDSTKTLEEFDLQMNQYILLEVQVDGIYEATVDDVPMKVLVTVAFLDQQFFLEGLKSSDTVGIVKNRVNDLVFQTPLKEDFLPLHPAIRDMVSLNGVVLEDDQTLASLPESCCLKGIIMHYLRIPDVEGTAEDKEHLHFLRLTTSARFIEEPHEEDWFMQIWGSEKDEKPNPVSIAKRPKISHGPLPSIDSGGLGINGPYELFDSENKILPLNGFELAVSIKTIVRVILLAPNPEIFKHLVFLNSKSEFLVLHVCWDMSYFFLRTLRTSYPKNSDCSCHRPRPPPPRPADLP